ncbi:MAG: patatin family protein [Clostridiales bacterium]|nr:patatin family protein [Clostridiales bacterium]
MKVGLVLEGGAMRGMYTAGVIDSFLDHDVHVDAILGVSAGACFGCNLFSGQRGRVLRYNQRFAGDPRNISIRSLITTGDIVNKEFAYYVIPTKYDIFDEEAFERHGGEYWVVVTNVETGEAEYMQMHHLLADIEMMRASASMPFCSKFVPIGGKNYLDGGVADSIPVRQALKMGFDKLIVVLTQPADYRKKPMNKAMIHAFYHRYPNLCKTLEERHARYNAQADDVAQLEKEGKIFVIRPEQALNIKRLEKDPAELERVYNIGLADGGKTMEALKAYLAR